MPFPPGLFVPQSPDPPPASSIMDSNDQHQQRNSLGFPYLSHFADIPLGGQSALDVDIDEAWKAFDLQSPQCVNPDQSFDGFRTSHDDLCAYPPKCPTAGVLGSSGNASSHMLFHTRHYNPQTGHQQIAAHSASSLAFDPFGSTSAASPGIFTGAASTPGATTAHGFSAGTPFGHGSAASPATPGTYHRFDHDDFVEQLSALSSPQRVLQECDDDLESTCDSDCGMGEICHDTACSSDPSACCEDETCLQNPTSTSVDAITSEDAIAAAALTSFVGQGPAQTQDMDAQEQSSTGHHVHHGHHMTMSTASSSSGMNLSLGPDLCISPQFLMNYQHLREAHNPLQPTSCNSSYCPIDDPKFYQECHLRHVMPPGQGLFDNIDLSMMMGSNPMDAVECGAKLPNSEAMIQHFFNEHQATLPYPLPITQHQQHQQNFHSIMGHVPGLVSSASSSVSMSSQDLMRTPSTVTSMDPGSLPLCAAASPVDSSNAFQQAQVKTTKSGNKLRVDISHQKNKGSKDESGQHTQQKHECYWCDTTGGSPCGHVCESAGDLHKHVLVAHTHLLKRDLGGTYSCGWFGCTRRDGEEKGGFAQKSKIDRHMQVHTGNKPFLCDICHQSFSANQALLQHKLIHEDSKPLSCEICGKTFRQHSALTMHIRTHTKVRPLKCPYCNKEFSESSNLSKHKRIHTGDGLYVCQYPGCGKHFHRKDQLRRHSTQHSKGRLSLSSPIETPSGTPMPE